MICINRSWLYAATLLPALLGGCTGPMQALDCMSTSLQKTGPTSLELDIALKVRDKTGKESEQKKYMHCEYDGVICYASGARHQWNRLSPDSSVEISTPNGQKIYFLPDCDDLTSGSLRFTDAFFVPRDTGTSAASWSYTSPALTGSDAMEAYGMQVIGIKINTREYGQLLGGKGREWKPALSWGYP